MDLRFYEGSYALVDKGLAQTVCSLTEREVWPDVLGKKSPNCGKCGPKVGTLGHSGNYIKFSNVQTNTNTQYELTQYIN